MSERGADSRHGAGSFLAELRARMWRRESGVVCRLPNGGRRGGGMISCVTAPGRPGGRATNFLLAFLNLEIDDGATRQD